jgi:hypothetical protein
MNFPEPNTNITCFCGHNISWHDSQKSKVGCQFHVANLKMCECKEFVPQLVPSHTLKDYKAPNLLQLRLEEHVAKAAAKWFELEKAYQAITTEYSKLPNTQNVPSIAESLGIKAVILFER